MAFTQNVMCNSFKVEILKAEHNFKASGGHTFKLALYDDSTTLNVAGTTVYPGAGLNGELAASGNYTQGGQALGNVDPVLATNTAIVDFSPDEVWTNATFTAYGCLLYNDTHASKAAVASFWFNGAKTATAGDFTVQFPTADASNAIIRIA